MQDPQLTLMAGAISPDPHTRETLATSVRSRDFRLDSKVLRFLDYALTFALETGAPLTPEAAGEYRQLVEALEPVQNPETILWAIRNIRDLEAEDQLARTLLDTMEILRIGKDGQRGLSPAITFLTSNLPSTVALEEEDPDLVAEYKERQARGSQGLPTGLSVLDHLTGGQEPGELWLIAAFASQGKSMLLQNISYHRRLEGYGGVIWSTEQSVLQIKRRLCTLHTLHPKWGRDPLDYSAIRLARLSREDTQFWFEVVRDWDNMEPPLEIRVAPAGSPIGSIIQRSFEISRKQQLDHITIDYLTQVQPSRPRGSDRETLTALFIETKMAALNFGKRGIPILTAAQTNPASFAYALEHGRYPLRSVAESAEAERSADVLLYLLRSEEDESLGQGRIGVLKHREGRSGDQFTVSCDMGHCSIKDQQVEDSPDGAWNVGMDL